MGFFDQTSFYEDYKYVMADAGSVGIGVKYTWQEFMEHAEVPFKLRAIVERYMLQDLSLEDTLESTLYYLEPKGIPYQTLCQLKAGIKFLRRGTKKRMQDGTFESGVMKLEEFCKIPISEKQEGEYVLQELTIGKLAMMMFTL